MIAYKKRITDIQKARAIIGHIGSRTQRQVMSMLMGASFVPPSSSLGHEYEAGRIVSDIADKYVLKIANELWKNNFNELPNWLKEY